MNNEIKEYDVIVPFRGHMMIHIEAPSPSDAIQGALLFAGDVIRGNLNCPSDEEDARAAEDYEDNELIVVHGFLVDDQIEIGKLEGAFDTIIRTQSSEELQQFNADGTLVALESA